MRAPDWAMNNIRTLEKKRYMWLDIVIYWVIPKKILTPPTEGTVFWPSPTPKFPKLLEFPSPQDFKVQRPPTHLNLRLLETVILIYTQCRRIVLGS